MYIGVHPSAHHQNGQLVDIHLTKEELLKLVEYSVKGTKYGGISDQTDAGTIIKITVQS